MPRGINKPVYIFNLFRPSEEKLEKKMAQDFFEKGIYDLQEFRDNSDVEEIISSINELRKIKDSNSEDYAQAKNKLVEKLEIVVKNPSNQKIDGKNSIARGAYFLYVSLTGSDVVPEEKSSVSFSA